MIPTNVPVRTTVARGQTPHVRLGPFLSFSLAQYDEAALECSGTNLCGNAGVYGDIEDTALHEWLMLGVRLTFGT